MIAELYPQAWAHLEAAKQAKSELATCWNNLLESNFLDVSVVTDSDSSGRIVVYANWPAGARDQLTALFRSCVNELWACLDALVVESVAMFSNLKRPRNPEQPRYFPIADCQENFDALLAESCLDGVLQLQFEMIRDCQPFQQLPEDERIERFRSGLRQLVDWTNRLDEGSRVGVWVTPIEPQVHVEEPTRIDYLKAQEPGELEDERVVARYKLSNYSPGSPVLGQPGTNVDLAFPDGFDPCDTNDTFDQRLNSVIDVVTRFAISFWWLASEAPVSKRLMLGTNNGPTVNWIEATRSPRQWTEEKLSALAKSDIGLGVVTEADSLILVVATPNGVYERIIPDASPLRRHIKRGKAAERAAEEAAATWGLPDFVIRPHVEKKGPGVREISDGLILVGDRGVIIQVKCREAVPDDSVQEARWIDKQIKRATGQVNGTARRLSMKTTEMTNGRGRRISIDGSTVSWVGAIIIDHPDPPDDYHIPAVPTRTPCIVLLRRDWEFLFNQLPSSRAVVDYLHRVRSSTELLGDEPKRYYELAAADAAATPILIDPVLERLGEPRSVPLLPAAPAGSDNDEAHGMVRIMCEDIANAVSSEHLEEDRLRILAAIDGLPVGYRTDLGQFLLEGLQAARQTEAGSIFWKFRTFRAISGEAQLGFGVCSVLSEITREAFRSWLLLRHHERGEREELSGALSIGVLLTPRHDGYRDWDTTMMAIEGDPHLTEDELRQLRELWNPRH